MSSLTDFIKTNGTSPGIELRVTPLSDPTQQFTIDQFLSYSFSSSVLIPVDAFTFTFALPNSNSPLTDFINEGDIAEIHAGKTTLCTGIIDVVDLETTIDGGEIVTVHGRNLIGQLEDQSTVNSKDKPMWGNKVSLENAVGALLQHTRIRGLMKQGSPSGAFLFATAPGETKLSALLRFLEPLNCLAFSDGAGNLVVGRPNMGRVPSGSIVMDRRNGESNCTSMKSIRASTQIPNIVIPVWTGQEVVQKRVASEQALLNASEGPSRLYKSGHYVPRCVVVSTPSGSDPASLSDVNAIKVGGSNLLQSYAVREIAKANISELTVQANVKGHFNDDLEPFLIDTVYNINYQRAGIQGENLYLYQVEYSCDATQGRKTSLYFCKLGRIVAGVSISPLQRQLIKAGALPTQ